MFSKKRKKSIVIQPLAVNVIDNDYIKDFVFQWNHAYPIDRWWRAKHKVAFNSPSHRDVSFIDMRFEFEEDMLFRKRHQNSLYIPDKGDWLEVFDFNEGEEFLTDEEKIQKYKKEFENIDLSQYNDPPK